MTCFYCKHPLELQLDGWHGATIGEVPTVEAFVRCRHCGAGYHIEQTVQELPNIGEEMIAKIREGG